MKAESPFTPPEAGVRTTSSTRRTAAHRVVGLLSWLLVVVGWLLAGFHLAWSTVAEPLLLVAVLIVAGVAITQLWIIHNRHVFNVRGPRARRMVRTPDWRRDYLNRKVEGPLDAARFAPYVEVTYTWERKFYRPAAMTELGTEHLLKKTDVIQLTWAPEEVLTVGPEAIRGHGAEEEEAIEDPEMTRGASWPGLQRMDQSARSRGGRAQ
jgi:hypothetical protein